MTYVREKERILNTMEEKKRGGKRDNHKKT